MTLKSTNDPTSFKNKDKTETDHRKIRFEDDEKIAQKTTYNAPYYQNPENPRKIMEENRYKNLRERKIREDEIARLKTKQQNEDLIDRHEEVRKEEVLQSPEEKKTKLGFFSRFVNSISCIGSGATIDGTEAHYGATPKYNKRYELNIDDLDKEEIHNSKMPGDDHRSETQQTIENIDPEEDRKKNYINEKRLNLFNPLLYNPKTGKRNVANPISEQELKNIARREEESPGGRSNFDNLNQAITNSSVMKSTEASKLKPLENPKYRS